ncbi:uncharacterized protein LOC105202088 [Solenopsis invicta]|uniref:uncharacterized protein LOC105202088 n=1 Tax=Solenopsis invicta TaxID=13686 RepID=UPI000595B976|nr:uncharacterized protein LOC105202088 [Solenopsis invicta]
MVRSSAIKNPKGATRGDDGSRVSALIAETKRDDDSWGLLPSDPRRKSLGRSVSTAWFLLFLLLPPVPGVDLRGLRDSTDTAELPAVPLASSHVSPARVAAPGPRASFRRYSPHAFPHDATNIYMAPP